MRAPRTLAAVGLTVSLLAIPALSSAQSDAAPDAVDVPLYRDTPTPEEALEDLSESVRAELPLSVLLLGMGADMHTASLFPGADRLSEGLAPDAPPVLPMRASGAPEPRVTLTAPVLTGAMSTHVVITGEEKRTAIEAARKLPPEQAPVSAHSLVAVAAAEILLVEGRGDE